MTHPLLLVASVASLLLASCGDAFVTFNCDSGRTVEAAYASDETATVRYQSKTHSMRSAVSGSGARYAGDALEWWTKGSGPGSDGTLFRHQADGTTGDIVERCAQAR